MREEDLQKIFDKAKSFDKNAPTTFKFHFYEVLGEDIYSDINYKPDDFKNLIEEMRKSFFRNENYENVKNCIEYIKESKFYIKGRNKKLYDAALKKSLKNKLEDIIESFVIVDNELDIDEENIVLEKGKEYGFTESEIENIIIEQKKILKFDRTDASKAKNEASSTATKSGYPTMDILYNGKVYETVKNEKLPDFIFDNVKLTETRRKVITIKNGGGGTLDATAVYSAKWIEVIPKKIHQSKLPQDVTIIVDPSKDKSLKNGSGGIMDTIKLTYASSGGTRSVPIVVKMAIEGHHNLVKRQTKYATIVSSVLASLMLFYIFSNYNFSGWAIFGFVVSAIAIGWAAFEAIEDENNMGFLIVGGIILLITNWTIFALLSTVIITFYAAKFIFEKNPFRNELIAAIPVGSYALFLILFFGTNNLRYSNYNYNNYNTRTQTQPTYTSTKSINRNAYIKADPIGNIRSGTSTNYSVLASLNKGEQVYVIEQDKATNWYRVKYRGNNYGYISDVVVSFDYVPKNSNTQSTSSNSTTKVNTNTFSKSTLIGNWKIDNGNSKYIFYSNGNGNYKNSRGKIFSFRWTVNNNYLKITLNSDNSNWNWKINSFSNNRISMYSQKRNLHRTITK